MYKLLRIENICGMTINNVDRQVTDGKTVFEREQ